MEPVRKFKTFTYHTGMEWLQARQGTLTSEGKQSLTVSSPPEFKGIPGLWTPEDLFVASVEICTMSTFLSFGGRKNIPLVAYKSKAEGLLENVDGKYRFTKIVITLDLTVKKEWTKEQVEAVVHEAHDNCLIANSMTTKVEIISNITLVD
jgi:organic hydroperoxide reductase OsmC/OhrA